MTEYIYRSNGEPLANERGEISLALAGEVVRCRDCLNCLQTTPKRSHEKTARAYAYACAKRPSETWRQINEELNAMGIGYKSAEGLRVAFCKAKKSHTSLQCSKFSHKVEPDGFCKWASRRDA